MQQDSLEVTLIKHLGNPIPTHKQIKLVQALLSNTGLMMEKIYDERLTKREIDCLALATLGLTSMETAEILKISRKTVEQYKHDIIKKLGAKNIAQAVIQGIKYGYIQKKEQKPE